VNRVFFLSVAMILLEVASPALARTPDDPKTTADIVAESEQSIALVKGKGSMGTGFLIKPGILVTNAHVIDDEFIGSLEIAFPSADETKKGPYTAELLYEDRKRDLAVLAVKVDLPPLALAPSYNFRKGEDITIIGNPGIGGDVVLENAVSRGVMSTKAEIEGQKFYQLGIAINPGNSGGPVFDSQGRVIGVATLKSAREESLAFSIPVEELQAAIDKVATQTPVDAEKARSNHRLKATVQGLGGGGAIYALGIDLKRISATPAGASSKEVRDITQKIDTVLAALEKEAFPAMTPEIALARKDTLLPAATRDKIGRFADNFAKLRAVYRAKPSDPARSKDTLKEMKTRHRQILTDLAKEMKIDVPEGLLTAFDDHPINATATAFNGVMPGSRNPNATQPGTGNSGGSLRDRIQQKKNDNNRPGARGSSGTSLRDRMKAKRGNN
jgi:S1-C subfamily serine protease